MKKVTVLGVSRDTLILARFGIATLLDIASVVSLLVIGTLSLRGGFSVSHAAAWGILGAGLGNMLLIPTSIVISSCTKRKKDLVA